MSEWTWEWTGYDPTAERLRESLCTLGNGYFATRGALPERRAGLLHYPATYVAGCYNRLESTVAGRQVVNEDLVNLPNWLLLRFRLRRTPGAWGPWLSPGTHTLLDHKHTLDLRRGTLTRVFRHRTDERGVLRVEQIRLVHMGDPHLAALRTVITAEDCSGDIEIESSIDGEVINGNVHRYRALNRHHVTHVRTGAHEPHTVWLTCRTSTSDISVALAARTRITADGAPASSVLRPARQRAIQRVVIPFSPGRRITVDKTVALHTSRDTAISDPLGEAVDRVTTAADFPTVLDSHAAAWERLWRRADIRVPGEAGRILRFHLFHVLQTLSPNTTELDVGVPARGLHGEAYRGHVFWDELFVLPYLNLHFPEVSRSLLNYRCRRLTRACRAAAATGRSGAMYPWQSGSDGREESQEWHLNPASGRWLPDHSRLQHHVGSAIAYNVWQYCEATGDTEYLHTRGAEMLLQIARFWAHLAVHDPGTDRYRIRGVVGPDEYHDSYPGAVLPGLDDNAYTNVTAAWVLTRTLELVRRLPAWRREELVDRLRLNDELPKWEEVSHRLRVPFHQGVISQFEGYDDLAELDWDTYRARYGTIRRLDRLLEAEGDSVNRYKASKQADVLMLGYLFSPSELRALFRRLGYDLDDDLWRRTVDYYLQRTSHGSTLSELVHGLVLARARRAEAWQYVHEALEADIADIQGGTTGEGIHLGAMAGTLDLVQRGLTGLETREDALWLNPVPLPALSEYGFTVHYRGHWGVGVRRRGGQLEISVPDSDESPIRVMLADRAVTIAPGETCSLVVPDIAPDHASRRT